VITSELFFMNAEPERIVLLSERISSIARQKISQINGVTQGTKILALNALIESARAGEAGRGFSVVAGEVKIVSQRITEIAASLSSELAGSIAELIDLGRLMAEQVRGQRMVDKALNMIEIIDRNLYERSCDVRWWATDAAVVDALEHPGSDHAAHASRRLGVILKSYTVYLDLWIADANGRVIANGRPETYPNAIGADVSNEAWFRAAMATRSGDDYSALDADICPALRDAQVAKYSTAVRSGGNATGRPLGALGIFFDWQPQAEAVVAAVRLSEEERGRTRCLLLDSRHRVLAASDGQGVMVDSFPLVTRGGAKDGYYLDSDGAMTAFALTPGYETYRGLGWYGVLVQTLPQPYTGGG
jgi:hypothetical protein